jgi:hypothetical protein
MRKASAYHEERVGGLDEALLLVLELLELRRRVEQVDVVLQHLFQYPPHKKSRSDAKNRIGSVDPHNKSGSKGEAARPNERVGVPSWRRARWWRRVLGGEERRRGESGGLGLEGDLWRGVGIYTLRRWIWSVRVRLGAAVHLGRSWD